MAIEYKSESLLVDSFIKTLRSFEDQVIVREMDIRHGNIDIVAIKSVHLPFSTEQIQILSKPASSLIFSYLKNNQYISKLTLQKNVGLSNSSLENTLNELTRVELIEKEKNKYKRKEIFEFPKTTITGYEAKLKNFNKAFFQAKNNRFYVDYSYMVFPIETANNIFEKYEKLLVENGIGLIGVSEFETKKIIRAKKKHVMKNHVRLLNIAKSLTYNQTFNRELLS